MNSSSHVRRGFTLLEVLIALAIVTLAVGALLGTVTSSASNVAYLHDKTLGEWVALNRLTEIRISQQMPDTGKRTGNAEMGGMRWQWEQEVTELPIKGMFRIDIRARPTGETVDDSRQVEKAASQEEAESEASGAATEKLAWTTTVTGIVSSARSDRRDAVAAIWRGSEATPRGNNQGPGENNPPTPQAPGMSGNPGITPGPRSPPPSPPPPSTAQ